jgi:hypothetical protein
MVATRLTNNQIQIRTIIKTQLINLRTYLSFFIKKLLEIIFSYTSRQSSHIKVIPWISIIFAPVHDKEPNISTRPLPIDSCSDKSKLKTSH